MDKEENHNKKEYWDMLTKQVIEGLTTFVEKRDLPKTKELLFMNSLAAFYKMSKEDECGEQVKIFASNLQYLIYTFNSIQEGNISGRQYTKKSVIGSRLMLNEILEQMITEFSSGKEIRLITELLILFEDIDLKEC